MSKEKVTVFLRKKFMTSPFHDIAKYVFIFPIRETETYKSRIINFSLKICIEIIPQGLT